MTDPRTDLRQLLCRLPVFAGDLPSFDPDEAPDDPVALFTSWLLDAVRRQIPEPHAMTVSTADADGNPSARTLILKDLDASGWRFAAHADSVVRGSAERAAQDFLARGAGARAEALLGRQSRPLTGGLAERDAAVAQSADRLAREPGLVAPQWQLFTVRAESVEFWQGDRERKHTRLVYQRKADTELWTKGLLWP